MTFKDLKERVGLEDYLKDYETNYFGFGFGIQESTSKKILEPEESVALTIL
jgi:hypothetical protein